MIKVLKQGIAEIIKLSISKKDIIVKKLLVLINDTARFIAQEFELEQQYELKNVTINDFKPANNFSYGVVRSKEEVVFGEWIFLYRSSTQKNTLYWLIVREAIRLFFNELCDIEKLFLNLLSFIWLKHNISYKSVIYSIFITIGRNIVIGKFHDIPETRLGNPFFVAYMKNINFIVFFNKMQDISQHKTNDADMFYKIESWINSTYTSEYDTVAPITMEKKYLPLIDYFLTSNYDQFKSSMISEKLGIHENTVRKYIEELRVSNYIHYSALKNFTKLKLYRYFLLVKLSDNNYFEQVCSLLSKNPYLASIYRGVSDSKIIYSPSLICPHIVSENLANKLLLLQKKGLIEDFTLQLTKERHRYLALTTSRNKLLVEPSIKTMKKLLTENHSNLPIKKYTIRTEKIASEYKESKSIIDYNLLFFLTFLTSKYVFTGDYAGKASIIPKLYERNNIPRHDKNKISKFLNQLEIRARKRKLLTYAPFFSIMGKIYPIVLIHELPLPKSKSEINRISSKLNVFGNLVRLTLEDRIIFITVGISFHHPVKKLLEKYFEKDGLDFNYYTIKLHSYKLVPYYDLFDYEEQKWKIEF
jgi:hypothetical protein